MKHIHMNVSGRVQGVGFRFNAQQKAYDCGVVGWVKNKHDGSVELEAKGEEEQVDRFVETIKHGPSPYAKVEDVHIEEVEHTKDFHTFEIR